MSRVVAEVRRFLDRHAVTGSGVVAVSGGADSVALLRAVLEAGAGPVVAVHINHGLRGAESDADEAFVRGLVESLWDRWPVGFGSQPVPVAEIARETGRNLEAVAREQRYEWMSFIAGPGGWVATGHTADDQAETVLHRLIRGTGVQGLRGIAAERDWRATCVSGPVLPVGESGQSVEETDRLTPAARLIRPLLSVTRAEILDYLASLGQPYRTDSSNADPRFTRNRIRHDLLPLLTTFNPEIVAVLGRLAGQADELFSQLQIEAAALLTAAELPRAGSLLVFDAGLLSAAPPHRVRDALRLVWEREGWPRDAMTSAHWHRLAALTPGDYPGGVRVRKAGKVVQIGHRK